MTDKENVKGGEKPDKNAVSKEPCELSPWPDYIQERLALWDKHMKRHKEELAKKASSPIKITLPDGAVQEGESWRTTPLMIADKISKGLAEHAVVAKVDNEVWDLDRPLEADCKLAILKFDDDEAKQVFWHSTAHVLGEAMERYYGGCLCYGPPIENGFYYDMYHEGAPITPDHFKDVEAIMKCAVKDKQVFERLELTKEELLEMFKYNKFKVRIINEKVDTPTTTAYRCGPLIDLCRGPHVRNTGKIKAFAVTKNSSSYWEGKADAESLQRVYGISFPDPKMLKEWQKFQEEAAARDHRRIGKTQDLFHFDGVSPGSCFFLPNGAHIYNTLVEMMRQEYRKRGFHEVISPNIFSTRLWDMSGHSGHYLENMFLFEVEKEVFALKPMNCPGHCMLYKSQPRTHAQLPIRWADFGVLHRNELSGALTGLTRVRRFQQDDAHIFARMDQIVTEIHGALEFMKHIYVDVFGFKFHSYLSTRPTEGYLGTLDVWDRAESQLKAALDGFGHAWSLNEGDGAFYGPKIDIKIEDALRRQHQCATIQLDFNLPERFDLSYADETGAKQRPVIIHRAILGSVERCIAMLTEHFGGKWPFWLSPRQLMLVPVHEKLNDHVVQLKDKLYAAGFEAEVNIASNDTFNKKIRNAQLDQFNFILVVGEKEAENGTVNVRTRDNKIRGEVSVDELFKRLTRLKVERVQDSEEGF